MPPPAAWLIGHFASVDMGLPRGLARELLGGFGCAVLDGRGSVRACLRIVKDIVGLKVIVFSYGSVGRPFFLGAPASVRSGRGRARRIPEGGRGLRGVAAVLERAGGAGGRRAW